MRINSQRAIRIGSHLRAYYGSWEAVREAGHYDFHNGVWVVRMPDDLKAIIDRDPICNPPVRVQWWKKWLDRFR